MRIVICDDDESCINDVKKHLSFFLTDNNITAEIVEYNDGNSLLNNVEAFDIAFLDIEIGNISGIDIARKLKEKNNHIIFFMITAYNKYLDDALDLNVFRFLEKPIDSSRFYSGIRKAADMIDDSRISFYMMDKDTVQKIYSSDIVYVEIITHGTKVVTENKTYFSSQNIKFWEEKLVTTLFFKVHSSFIVNLKYITHYQRNEIILDGKYTVPVAYRTQPKFKRYFFKYCSD